MTMSTKSLLRFSIVLSFMSVCQSSVGSCKLGDEVFPVQHVAFIGLPFTSADPFEAPRFLKLRCLVSVNQSMIDHARKMPLEAIGSAVWVIEPAERMAAIAAVLGHLGAR